MAARTTTPKDCFKDSLFYIDFILSFQYSYYRFSYGVDVLMVYAPRVREWVILQDKTQNL